MKANAKLIQCSTDSSDQIPLIKKVRKGQYWFSPGFSTNAFIGFLINWWSFFLFA